MKNLFRLFAALGLVVCFGFSSTEINNEEESGAEFYYCYIEGYYNGDSEQRGWYFSSVREMEEAPSSDCSAWKEYTESQLKYFTAECSSYTVYGPFGVGDSSYAHHKKKMRQFKDLGKVLASSRGPK